MGGVILEVGKADDCLGCFLRKSGEVSVGKLFVAACLSNVSAKSLQFAIGKKLYSLSFRQKVLSTRLALQG